MTPKRVWARTRPAGYRFPRRMGTPPTGANVSRRLIAGSGQMVLAIAILLAAATNANAHAQLDHAVPAVGSTIASSPSEVTLTFSEKLEPRFSGGEVRNSAGARVDHGVQVNGNIMQISVGALPAGAYSVTWHVLSVDTHKTQGSFGFNVGK
jgi:copper resistance protein C